MTVIPTYPEFVASLVKPGQEVLLGLSAFDVDILHAAVGISGEAGELLDAIKKVTIYRKEPDRANIIEELGDLEFYMEALRATLAITREETIVANINKLKKRYAAGKYSDKQAQDRADKAV